MPSRYPVLSPQASQAPSNGLCALAVMSKAPCAGMVKTRLVPPLTPEEAAALNVCFLRDMAANIAGVARSGEADGVAVYTPVGAESAYDGLLPEGFSLLAQRGASLGDRLFHAAEDLLAVGYGSLCLIDSDSPTLPGPLLRAAVAALKRPGDRVPLRSTWRSSCCPRGMTWTRRRRCAAFAKSCLPSRPSRPSRMDATTASGMPPRIRVVTWRD